jgi:hypothetical protein
VMLCALSVICVLSTLRKTHTRSCLVQMSSLGGRSANIVHTVCMRQAPLEKKNKACSLALIPTPFTIPVFKRVLMPMVENVYARTTTVILTAPTILRSLSCVTTRTTPRHGSARRRLISFRPVRAPSLQLIPVLLLTPPRGVFSLVSANVTLDRAIFLNGVVPVKVYCDNGPCFAREGSDHLTELGFEEDGIPPDYPALPPFGTRGLQPCLVDVRQTLIRENSVCLTKTLTLRDVQTSCARSKIRAQGTRNLWLLLRL